MALGTRVKQAREARKLNQTQLADGIGWTPQAVSLLERRDSKKSDRAESIADYLRVNLTWLLSGRGDSGLGDLIPTDEGNSIVVTGRLDAWDEDTPLLADEVLVTFADEVEFDCGPGRVATEFRDTGKKTRFNKKILDKVAVRPKDVVVAKAYGNSNYPLIMDGATIAYDESKAYVKLKEDKLYAMEVDGGLKIKTLRFIHGKKVDVCSFNKDYPCITMSEEEFYSTHRILGWVFWWENVERW